MYSYVIINISIRASTRTSTTTLRRSQGSSNTSITGRTILTIEPDHQLQLEW